MQPPLNIKYFSQVTHHVDVKSLAIHFVYCPNFNAIQEVRNNYGVVHNTKFLQRDFSFASLAYLDHQGLGSIWYSYI